MAFPSCGVNGYPNFEVHNVLIEHADNGYQLENWLISQVLNLTRQEMSLSLLGKKIIGILEHHPLFAKIPLALWLIEENQVIQLVTVRQLGPRAKDTLKAELYIPPNERQFIIHHCCADTSSFATPRVRTDVYLDCSRHPILGFSFWSESSLLERQLNAPFFCTLFSLISLTLVNNIIRTQLNKETEVRRQIQRRLMEQEKQGELIHAAYDALTNLPNRLYGYNDLERSIAASAKAKKKLAVLFLDLDEFKQINESLGHSIGDALLKILAQRYLAIMREFDTLVRMGGDEFMIILRDLTDKKYALHAAKLCLEVSLQPFKLESQEIYISSSIGVALFPEHGTDAKTLMRNADAAMYHSKLRGKNKTTIYAPRMSEHAAYQLQMKAELYQALSRDEFYLCYQPIIDLHTNQVFAVEALLRWNSPLLGHMMPSEIIPTAEESGLIVPLGYWVLKTVCAQLKQLQAAVRAPIKMALNVSTVQLKQQDFVVKVGEIISNAGISPESLIFEITESVFIDDLKFILAQLNQLDAMKIHCSLDDFGMGYSSLSYVRNYPFKSLKIDKVFTQRIDINQDDLSLVKSIISMSRSLKLVVIAEGIESETQCRLLRSMNCDMVQGWYFSEAVVFDELLVYLSKHS
jgi:diguanylate cyclase (GGDEF)-like protein